MNSACTWWVLAGQIVSELSINSTQTHWVNAPSPPVLTQLYQATSSISMSSINNSSQANSDIATIVVPHVHFDIPEATPVASSSTNPDGRRHHHQHGQQATHRFHRVGSMEIEFSMNHTVSLLVYLYLSCV